MSRLIWHHAKRIFWFNFNKPHHKLGLLGKDGRHNLPRNKNGGRRLIDKTNHKPSRSLIAAAHKALSTHITVQSRQRLLSVQIRWFHTTSRRQIPPILWVVLKPLGKVWAMLWGRYIRRWWGAMPSDRRTHYKELFGGMKGIIIGLVSAAVIAVVANYVVHLEENPLTGRMRFISLSHDQINTVAEYEQLMYQEKYTFLKPDHKVWRLVSQCATRIIQSNEKDCEEIRKLNWVVSVIDDDNTNNAFVLPNGHIFVFTGLVKDMKNTDQLAVILGHEMAHAVMGHAVEHISRGQIIDFLMIAVLAAIWTFVPGDGIAIVTQWFYNRLITLMLELPYSRELESEADTVGLEFAAKACFDVREAPALWAWQDAKIRWGDKSIPFPEFLSTHPANETRTQRLMENLPKALQIRDQCSCPKLDGKCDPLKRVNEEIKQLQLQSQASAQPLDKKEPSTQPSKPKAEDAKRSPPSSPPSVLTEPNTS